MGENALRPDQLFDSQIDLHDRQHFEIAFNYDVSPSSMRSDGRARFSVDAFFFLPTNLGVSALSYGKDDFFKDVLSYLRYKTPNLSGAELADPLNPHSPLNILSFNLKQLVDRAQADPALETSTVNEAKLFGCILIANWRNLRKDARKLGQHLTGGTIPPPAAIDGLLDLQDRLQAEHHLLYKFRTLRQSYIDNRAVLSKRLIDTLYWVDEYLTYRFDENLAKIHERMPHEEADDFDPPLLLALHHFESFLSSMGELESGYRQQEGFIEISADVPERLELYTYRTGALKKYMAKILFLDVQTVREIRRYQSLVAALGAGLAAFWSTLGDRNVNFRLHGVSTTVLIVVIVLTYILKDRIKDFFKEYLASQVQRLLPDQKLTISDPMTQLPIGTCRQVVKYEEKRKIPLDIKRLRDLTHVVDLDEAREEEILSYQHSMTLEARTIHSTHHRLMHVKQILRYSVGNLLKRLSDPYTEVSCFNPETDRFEVVLAPKVYHVNVVFRVSQIADKGPLPDPVYHRVRIVLNKDGIERVEKVVQNKRLWEIEHLVDHQLQEQAEHLHLAEAEDLSPS